MSVGILRQRQRLGPRSSRAAEVCSVTRGPGTPKRLKVVRYLADRARNVTEIAEILRIPPMNLSHHLTVLKHASLIRCQKRSQFVLYSLTPAFSRMSWKRVFLGSRSTSAAAACNCRSRKRRSVRVDAGCAVSEWGTFPPCPHPDWPGFHDRPEATRRHPAGSEGALAESGRRQGQALPEGGS